MCPFGSNPAGNTGVYELNAVKMATYLIAAVIFVNSGVLSWGQ